MRRLTVLQVAYPMAPTGPDSVGGAEQVLTAIDHALVESGHESLVIACEGSQAAGRLIPTPAPPSRFDDATLARHQAATAARIVETIATQHVDLIHLHGIDFHTYLPPPGPPVLATVHLPPDWYPAAALAPSRPDTWLHGVSHAQSLRGAAILPPILNGVDVERLAVHRPRRCDYALLLARICPEKGVHLALEAAHATGTRLLIAGTVFPYAAHQAYFETEVRPRLDRRRRYLGPVGFTHKRRLLAAARCLLIPSLAAETSSLVAMEAAACGTPVIAFPHGALPETVEDGRTGHLVQGVDGLARGIARAAAIDPDTCRATARRRFGLGTMTGAYLARYQSLAR